MASTYLSRTASGGSRTTWTISTWVKRGSLGSSLSSTIFNGIIDNSNETQLLFNNDSIEFYDYSSASRTGTLFTNAKYRDTSAWYHIVAVWDTTNATAGDRMRLYVNGVEETSFATDTQPSSSQNSSLGNGTYTQQVGLYSANSSYYFNGSMAHFHFIDGTAYDASAFGETDATTGIWKSKLSPSVTYGTNGFFLKFNEGALGTDSSPNGNNFTVNGSLTPSKDTPDNVFATLNPLYPYTSTGAFTNGNTAPSDYNGLQGIVGTLGVSSGKWYFEVKASSTPLENMVGWGARDNGAINFSGGEAYDYCRYLGYANYYNNSSATAISGASAYSAGDICGCALDLDGNKIYWYKNGVLENTGGTTITASSTAGNYFPLVRNGNGSNIQCNFGNGYFGTTPVASAGSNGNGAIFEYDVPTGYYALNTKNINTYG